MTVFDRYEQLESTQYDMHYDLEIGVVCSGKVTRRYQDLTQQLGPGDIWVAGIWEPHGFYLDEVVCEMMCIMVSPECISGMLPPGLHWMSVFTDKNHRCPYIKPEYKQEIINRCRTQVKLEEKGAETAGVWRLNTLSALLLYILDSNPGLYEEMERNDKAFSNTFSGVEKALNTIVAKNGLVSVKEAALSVNWSTSHFSREFKRITGSSFGRFTMAYRIKQSAVMLINTDASVKQIAAELGFRDSSHYIKCFESYFFVSPTAYRKLNKV